MKTKRGKQLITIASCGMVEISETKVRICLRPAGHKQKDHKFVVIADREPKPVRKKK